MTKGLLWICPIAVVGLLLLPRFTDYDILIVRGGSMEPAIHAGSIEIIDRNDQSPNIGDVVAFRENGNIVTHRIVAFEGSFMVTKGDANETEDAVRRRGEDVIGPVVADVPHVGRILYVVQQPPVFLLLLALTGGVLICGEVRVIHRKVREIRASNRAVESSSTHA
jgi:signal peptidase I